MASSILDLNMVPVSSSGKAAPKITAIHPFGSSILVELLTDQELTSDNIIISGGGTALTGSPQAYVLEVGPSITAENVTSLVGKRVILNGTGTNLPEYGDGERVKLLVEMHTIKGVIEENETCGSGKKVCCRTSTK